MAENRYNVTRAVIGSCSLTLVLPICIAEELGIRNGEMLRCDVNGKRLIVEKKKYPSSVTGQTTVTEGDY
jgi:bifunctional DNA-binding transcriptional regulator/antitoxin component of YhaV-PrlF toxin-antitoxin module